MIWFAALVALYLGGDAADKLQHPRQFAAGLFEAIVCGLIVVGLIVIYAIRGDDD